jgi:hypothetical protein
MSGVLVMVKARPALVVSWFLVRALPWVLGAAAGLATWVALRDWRRPTEPELSSVGLAGYSEAMSDYAFAALRQTAHRTIAAWVVGMVVLVVAARVSQWARDRIERQDA